MSHKESENKVRKIRDCKEPGHSGCIKAVRRIRTAGEDYIDVIVGESHRVRGKQYELSKDDELMLENIGLDMERELGEYFEKNPGASPDELKEAIRQIGFRIRYSVPFKESSERARYKEIARILQKALLPEKTVRWEDGPSEEDEVMIRAWGEISVEKSISRNLAPITDSIERTAAESLIADIAMMDLLVFDSKEWWRTAAIIERCFHSIEQSRKSPLIEYAVDRMSEKELGSLSGANKKRQQGKSTEREILKEYGRLTTDGRNERVKAGLIAKRIGKSSAYVREVLKVQAEKHSIKAAAKSLAKMNASDGITHLAKRFGKSEEEIYQALSEPQDHIE